MLTVVTFSVWMVQPVLYYVGLICTCSLLKVFLFLSKTNSASINRNIGPCSGESDKPLVLELYKVTIS